MKYPTSSICMSQLSKGICASVPLRHRCLQYPHNPWRLDVAELSWAESAKNVNQKLTWPVGQTFSTLRHSPSRALLFFYSVPHKRREGRHLRQVQASSHMSGASSRWWTPTKFVISTRPSVRPFVQPSKPSIGLSVHPSVLKFRSAKVALCHSGTGFPLISSILVHQPPLYII